MATVLGPFGAGGIGQIIWEYICGFYYGETAAVMTVIVVTVSLLAPSRNASAAR